MYNQDGFDSCPKPKQWRGEPTMAKVNVHTASREELVESGLRAEIADEILRLRRKGEIAGPEALEEVPGVGPATVEQLRKSLDFKAPDRGGEERRDRESKAGAEETVRAAADANTTAARAILRVAHEGGAAAGAGQRELADSSARGMVELNQLFMELMREQLQQSLDTWNAMARAVRWDEVAKAVDWREVTEIQSRCLQQNLERTTQVARRCLELGQAMVESVATERRSDRAA
jgi:hypothetical protein